MKMLVAGGAGFIGSHLIDSLLNKGHDIICADKLIFGDGNIQHLLNDNALTDTGKFKFYQMELADQSNVDKLFSENRIDAVYHMAANSDIQKGGLEPSIDFNDTLLTTRTLLEGMRKADVKKIFFASTSAVYGEMPGTMLTEKTGGLMPVSYYGGAKLASEALISSYVAMCDMNAVVFRFPNVIGPRLTHGAVFDFIRKLRKNPKELEILGNGKQCKPYIYVMDLVDVIMKLTECFTEDAFLSKESSSNGLHNSESWQDVYNISIKGEGTEVTRIAEIVTDVLGLKDVEFKYTGGDRGWKGDVPKFDYDISKVLSTGWEPRYSSDEAVRQTVIDAVNAGM